VDSLVLREGASLGKTLFALVALVRLFARMCANMLDKIRLLVESLLAMLTGVRFFPRMNKIVPLQVVLMIKPLSALLARKRPTIQSGLSTSGLGLPVSGLALYTRRGCP